MCINIHGLAFIAKYLASDVVLEITSHTETMQIASNNNDAYVTLI